MQKSSLAILFLVVMVVVSQLENFQNALNALMQNGIPPAFFLAMLLSLAIFVALWHSLKHIKRIRSAQ